MSFGNTTVWYVRGEVVVDDTYEERMKDLYQTYTTLFSLKVHHGGRFTKYPRRRYVGGKIDYVDLCDTDQFSVIELNCMIERLGYKDSGLMYYHFKKPDNDLDFGLFALRNDKDVLHMSKYVSKHKYIEVYVEHRMTKANTYFKSPDLSNVVIEELEETSECRSAKCFKKLLFLEYAGESSNTKHDMNVGKDDVNTYFKEALKMEERRWEFYK